MKNILMITPFFAPYSHASVYRAHKFAKYLPRFGWKPYVLTVDKSFTYFIDNALLDDLPKEVEIIRARHIDLTYSGFKTLFKKFEALTASDLTAKLVQERKAGFIKRIINKFRNEFLFLPDRYITWYPAALKKAKRIADSKHIDIIYSTAPPFTPHLIAAKLKKLLKIPWVADFRDPGVDVSHGRLQTSYLRYKIDNLIEKIIMKNANLILTASEDTKDLFLSKYEGIVNNKIVNLKHSTDTEILESANLKKKNKKFTIIFAGEFLQEYSRKLFEFLKVISLQRGLTTVIPCFS